MLLAVPFKGIPWHSYMHWWSRSLARCSSQQADVALCYMPTLVVLPAPSPGPGQGICSKQKQDIGSGKEDVFSCSHALQRTYHCKDVTGPRPAVGYKYVCTSFSLLQTGEEQGLVTISHRTVCSHVDCWFLPLPSFSVWKHLLRAYQIHQALCWVLSLPRLNGTLFLSLGSSQSNEEKRKVSKSFRSEGRRQRKPLLLVLTLCWAPHSHSKPHLILP